MLWKSRTGKGSIALPMLATMFFLAACSPTLTTRTSGTDATVAEIELRIVRDVCRRAWRPQTYSSRDTPETQLEAQANNAARAEYCRGVE